MAAFQAMGTSPDRLGERRERRPERQAWRDRLGETGLAMMGAATLKKKGSKPSDPDVFWGSSLRSSFCTSDSVTACREKHLAGQGKKREKHRGLSH